MILLVSDKLLRHSEVREPQSEGLGEDRLPRRGPSLVSSLFLGPQHYCTVAPLLLRGSLCSEAILS